MTGTPNLLTATPGCGPKKDPLDSALDGLRLEGALFFRGELTDPFEFESSPLTLADALVPGADRLTLFHIVAAGACWIAVDDGVRYVAQAGDVIVLPYADRYVMGGGGAAERVSILTLLEPLPWARLPTLRHGGGGRRTEVVCGYLHSPDPLFDPAMRALPPLFVVRLRDSPAARWVRASIDYALADDALPSNMSTSATATRLPELVVSEVLRAHLATAPAIDRGWIAALRDPRLAPALAAMHTEPTRRWTVAALAASVGSSRSSLDDRFRLVLGQSPIRYLTAWRMHLASDLLTTTDLSVFTIARRVGYEAEEAFSRAFKRERGVSPSRWRTAARDERHGTTVTAPPPA
jgi:AraC-like DNA-binding protein